MGKTIAVTDRASKRSKSLKKREETSSTLPGRITPGGILELAAVLTAQEGKTMKRIVKSMRRGSSGRISSVRVKQRAPRQD